MVRALGGRHRTRARGGPLRLPRRRQHRALGRADGPGGARGFRYASPQPAPLMLADTGSADTTPYLLGGTLFLGIGAGFVTFSVHRSRSAL